ncbi:peptidylprolyl isomerase [Corynebacterium sp. sy039]|uniref:peptidylprolyl isomerase n=1 Tax=Corynebacterium sp. sy039 TaxID=2599641 RepID=UPI0011B4FD7D|nr:peptidylprolyl isomerase [Corynebacterium sp. sy039]QDZ42694.1 peptidylprolyl isomerase [Corynebacterium sp. sy039]
MSKQSNEQRRKDAISQLEKHIKAKDRSEKTRSLLTPLIAALVIAVVAVGIIYATTRDDKNSGETEAKSSQAQTTETKPVSALVDDKGILKTARSSALPDTVSCNYPDNGTAAKEVSAPKGDKVSTKGTVKLTFVTNQGDIPLTLDRSVSPCTVNAIEHLAKSGYYNDTICHRVSDSGFLQCGDPTGTGTGGPGFSFADEYPVDSTDDQSSPVKYPRGSIAMANSGPNTNGSQFFLNSTDHTFAPSYTYFGTMDETGIKTVENIVAAGIGKQSADGTGAPAKEVRITKATVQ